MIKRFLIAAAVCCGALTTGGNAMAGGAPAPPAALRLQVVEEGFKITWRKSPDDPAAVTGYEVVRGNFLGGPFTSVCKVPAGTTTCVDTTARRESIYFFKVRALAPEGASPYSREATGEIPGKLI